MLGYWRIRLKDGNHQDRSEEAWKRNEVGVWYGAWAVNDLINAEQSPIDAVEVADILSNLPAQKKLKWAISADFVNTVRRFRDIPQGDWVVLYLPSTQEIGLAKISGELSSRSDHPLNSNGEVFKVRSITDQKTFPIAQLPDAYRLIPSQGRGNVHQFNNMREHVRLLADLPNSGAVNAEFRRFPFDRLLDMLGASAWESFALAYLIMEYEFVPTGLSTGRTLPIADIVGRRRDTQSRVVAQCKKHPIAQPIDQEFVNLAHTLQAADQAFYFAFGGCDGEVLNNVHVIDRNQALEWANTPNGQLYRNLIVLD